LTQWRARALYKPRAFRYENAIMIRIATTTMTTKKATRFGGLPRGMS
jgi:hypothetical protein